MNQQQIVTFDGRRFLVETIERQVVTELVDHERGREISGADAGEAIALAEQIQASQHLPGSPHTDLSTVLTARWELETESADPFARAAVAFAVQQLLTDPELSELLDRERYTQGGAAA